jgi:citrate lyase beta subunit
MMFKKETAIKEKIFVPVAIKDTRPHAEKWLSERYLIEIEETFSRDCVMAEVTECLSALRNAADLAEAPEQLQGINVGIREMKKLLTLSARAKYVRDGFIVADSQAN